MLRAAAGNAETGVSEVRALVIGERWQVPCIANRT